MSTMFRKSLIAIGLVASMATAAAYQSGWGGEAVPLKGAPKPVRADPAIGVAVQEWSRLRQSDSLPFGDYAAFLIAHPGWPGELAMRRTAEKALKPDAEQPATVAALFARMPPMSNAAKLRHAEALATLGRQGEAAMAARAAWTGGALSTEDEARLLARFAGVLTQADNDKRMEALLWQRASTAAGRQLALVSPARQPIYAARVAMQRRAPDAMMLGDEVRPMADRDPGFELDRALWLRDTSQSPAARAYLARPVQYDGLPFMAEIWMEGMLAMARAAAADGQPGLAYGIASRADLAFAPGTNVRLRTAGERDDYTSLVWLAGWTALKKLNRPADALVMFRKYAAAAKSPSSQSKGQYWAGRAAEAAGRRAEADQELGRAASHYDQFYGQLAAERLGHTLPLPAAGTPPTPSPAAQAAFDNDELVRAARWLGANGSWQDQTQFVRAIAARTDGTDDHALAVRLAEDLARPDLGVMVARTARADGSTDYLRSGFPEMALPATLAPRWIMIHAISRQESQFDREALSIAGARGMMQLMPATAREQAGKLGLPYEPGRLVTDPAYNATLGSAYFQRMLDHYGGSYVLSVAAYNAGPGNVNKFIRANGDPRLPTVDTLDWIEAIPLSETRGYVQRVLENAVVYSRMNPTRPGASGKISTYLGKTVTR